MNTNRNRSKNTNMKTNMNADSNTKTTTNVITNSNTDINADTGPLKLSLISRGKRRLQIDHEIWKPFPFMSAGPSAESLRLCFIQRIQPWA